MFAMVQRRLGLGLPFSGKDLPKPPRLLYLLSPCLTQQLSYWPSSVQVWPACPIPLVAVVACNILHQLAYEVSGVCGMWHGLD